MTKGVTTLGSQIDTVDVSNESFVRYESRSTRSPVIPACLSSASIGHGGILDA